MADHEVVLLGGLGNQLFQVAFGRYLTACSGRGVRYVAAGRTSVADLVDVTGLEVGRDPRGVNPLGRLAPLHRLLERARGRSVRVDMGMSPWVAPEQTREARCWCGYWQQPAYVDAADDLVADVRARLGRRALPAFAGADGATDRAHVAVHVRRGDYVGLVPLLAREYYAEAFAEVCRYRGLDPEATVALLVTNDPDWARATIALPTPHVVTVSGAALDDFATLSRAEGIVLSQSTFSWWAARLSEGATVAAPRPWRLGHEPVADDGALLRLDRWLSVDAGYDTA